MPARREEVTPWLDRSPTTTASRCAPSTHRARAATRSPGRSTGHPRPFPRSPPRSTLAHIRPGHRGRRRHRGTPRRPRRPPRRPRARPTGRRRAVARTTVRPVHRRRVRRPRRRMARGRPRPAAVRRSAADHRRRTDGCEHVPTPRARGGRRESRRPPVRLWRVAARGVRLAPEHDRRAVQRRRPQAARPVAAPGCRPGLTRGRGARGTFIDSSAASFSTQIWADGHPGLARATNDVADGIRSVSRLLAAGRLFVHRSCEGLLTELPGYSWDPKATDRGEDAPLKVDGHSADAVHSTAHAWRHLLTSTNETSVP